MASSAKGVSFGCFMRRIASFRLVGVQLRDVSTYFGNVRKIVLLGRRNTSATFAEDALMIFVAGAELSTYAAYASSFCVAGAAHQMCGVACFLRIVLSGLCQGMRRCKFRGRGGILRDVMKIRVSIARNIELSGSKFAVL